MLGDQLIVGHVCVESSDQIIAILVSVGNRRIAFAAVRLGVQVREALPGDMDSLVALCLAMGVPIAFCFGLGTLAFIVFTTRVPLIVLVGRMDEGMSSLILLSVPIFVLLGCVLVALTIALGG